MLTLERSCCSLSAHQCPTSMATLWTGAGWESSRMGLHVRIVTTRAWNLMVIIQDREFTILICNKCEHINAAFFKVSLSVPLCLLRVRAYLCVSIPGHGGCKLTGGLTLLNPLLGVLRMMMWAVDTPWWFRFLRASSRSQIEKLWGYYKVRGWLTLNMMTIPCWHFHFLKRPVPSRGQMCLLIFVQITFILLFRSNIWLKHIVWPLSCFPFINTGKPEKILINMAFQSIHMHEIKLCLHYTNVSFSAIFFLFLSFCPSNAFRGTAMQPTSGSNWCF